MTLNDHFTLNFYYYEQPFEKQFLHTYRRSCFYPVTSGDVRKRTVIRSRRIFGIGEGLQIFRRRYIGRTVTNGVNIIIN